MTLRSLMDADLAAVFFRATELGGSISLSAPWRSGSLQVSALVGERELVDSTSQFGNSDRETVTILVANDAITGIDRPAFGSTMTIDSDTEPDPQKRIWTFVEQVDCDQHARLLKFERITLREIVSQTSQITP